MIDDVAAIQSLDADHTDSTKYGRMEAYATFAVDSLMNNPLSKLMGMGELAMAKSSGSEKISPEEANEKYGIKGALDFKDSITPEAARLLSERKRDEMFFSNIVNNSDMGWASKLGIGFAASFLDPINMAASYIPIGWFGRGAELAGDAAKVGLATRMARQAVHGAAGAAAIEPIYVFSALQEQSDYDFAQGGINLLFGAGMGSLGGVHEHLIMSKMVTPETKGEIYRAAAAATERGEEPRVDRILDLDRNKVAADVQAGRKLTPEEWVMTKQFVKNGEKEHFGMIDIPDHPEVQKAPIKLQEGYHNTVNPDNPKEGGGFGRVHLERRLDELKQNGYDSVEGFVSDVSQNYNKVYQDGDRLLLVKELEGKKPAQVVELDRDGGDFYTVVSGWVSNKKSWPKKELIWESKNVLGEGRPSPLSSTEPAGRVLTVKDVARPEHVSVNDGNVAHFSDEVKPERFGKSLEERVQEQQKLDAQVDQELQNRNKQFAQDAAEGKLSEAKEPVNDFLGLGDKPIHEQPVKDIDGELVGLKNDLTTSEADFKTVEQINPEEAKVVTEAIQQVEKQKGILNQVVACVSGVFKK